ncbi:MAG: hypothetical protein WDM91_14425 [Rhizomicrobium sp.]
MVLVFPDRRSNGADYACAACRRQPLHRSGGDSRPAPQIGFEGGAGFVCPHSFPEAAPEVLFRFLWTCLITFGFQVDLRFGEKTNRL